MKTIEELATVKGDKVTIKVIVQICLKINEIIRAINQLNKIEK